MTDIFDFGNLLKMRKGWLAGTNLRHVWHNNPKIKYVAIGLRDKFIWRHLKTCFSSQWRQRNGGVSDPLGLSPLSLNSLNSLNSCNSPKDSLLNVQTSLRDPRIETSKGGQGGVNQTGEARKENSLKEPQTQPCIPELTVGLSLDRRGIRLWMALPSAGRRREI